MNLSDFIQTMTSNVTILGAIPAAILCYIPMAHQMRRPLYQIVIHCAILMVLAVIGTTVLLGRFPYLDSTVVLVPFLALFFVYYALSTRAQVFQSTGIFLMICGFYAIISYAAYLIAASPRFDDSSLTPGQISSILQLVLIVAFSIPAAIFLRRVGMYLVDHLRAGSVWLLIAATSLIVFVILSVMAPKIRLVYDTTELSKTYLIIAAMVSLLYVLSCAFFFMTSVSLIQKEELQEQETVYRMQREQYRQLEDQTEKIRILRHDFRHTLGVLQRLAAEDDIDGIREYLAQYENSIPTQNVVHYCDDDLLNAILNHYADRAASKQTRTDFRINVPQMSKEQTFDFASVLTNLLENAQQGCDTVEPIDRSIGLRLDVVNDDNLFMVVSNSFDGNVRKVGDRYLSTRRKRGDRGTGLRSIERTVARYDGEVEFYHKGRIFYVDLTMKVEKDSEES